MHKSKLLIILLLTPWIATFAQTTTKPPIHHTVKPVAAPVDPVDSAMKAVTVALKPNEDLGATYLFTGGISLQADETFSKITTVGCVLSYTVTVDQSATDKSGMHQIFTHVMDLKNAVPIQAVPDPGLYEHDPDLDMSHSHPFYGFLLKSTIPQPRQSDSTGFTSKGSVPEKHDSTPRISTGFYSKTLEDSVHLKEAINSAIQACGGSANVAPPEPVKPPPPAPKPPPETACKDTGPSLAETQQYILLNSKDSDSLDRDTDAGTFTEITNVVVRERYIVDFMSLDCGATNLNTTTDGQLRAWLECKSGQRCIDYSWHDSGEWREKTASPLREHGFATQSGDTELTRNLQHALMHYIFLLQQEFRTKHGQNDPFGQ